MLLTNEVLVAFDNATKRSLRLGLAPINTDLLVEHRRVYLVTSKRYFYLNWLNRVVTWAELIVLACMIYIGMVYQSLLSRSFIILLAFVGMLILIFICLDYCFTWHGPECVAMINNAMEAWELTDEFDDTQTTEDKESDKNVAALVALLINTTYYVGCLAGFGCSFMPFLYFKSFSLAITELFQLIIFPLENVFGEQFIFESFGTVIIPSLVLTLFIMWWYLTICFVVEFGTLASWIAMGGYYANYTLKYKFRSKTMPLKWRSPVVSIQHPKNAIKIYRVIDFTFQRALEFAGCLYSGGVILGTTVACIALYSIIRHSSGSTLELVFFCGVLIMVFIGLTVFHFIGQNYVLSCNILDSWKYVYLGSAKFKSKRWKIESRRIRAIRPIQVYVVTAWFVDGLALAHILDAVIDKTIFLLNVFPSD